MRVRFQCVKCYEERYRERVLRALSQRAAKLGMQMVPIAPVGQPA